MTSPLKVYAEAKRLPTDFLETLKVKDKAGLLEIPYFGKDRKHIRSRLRDLNKERTPDRWWSDSPNGILPYGEWRLYDGKYCILAEGESDTQTFWFHGYRCLGIPGWSSFKPGWAESLKKYEYLYLCKDNDKQGGGQFVENTIAKLKEGGYQGRIIILRAPYGCKDFSDLHIKDPDKFKATFKRIEADGLKEVVKISDMAEAQDEPVTPTELPVADLSKILPADGWLADYYQTMASATDAPGIFHLTTGLAILATACGNKIYIPEVAGRRYLNIYLINLSPAGDGRKSTCIKPAEVIFKNRDVWPKPMILANDFSLEAQNKELADNPERVIIASEFKAAFDVYNGRDYNKGGVSRLVALFDGDPIDISRSGEELVRAENIALSVVAGSTAEWFIKSLDPSQYQAGLWGRFLIAYAKRTEFRESPGDVYEDIKDHGLIIRTIIDRFQDEPVDFALCQKEQSAFSQEAQGLLEELGADPKGSLLTGGAARLSMYANKIAALYSISERREAKPTPEDYERAAELMRYLFGCQKYLVYNELALSPIEAKRNSLKKVIFDQPGITKSDLTRKSQSLSMRERDTLLAEMLEGKFIRQTEKTTSTKPLVKYYPYSYQGTPK